MMVAIKSKKIIVALSGGVDSAVAATLLKKQGFAVMGVFMRFFSGRKDEKSSRKAKKIAVILEIPFRKIDARKEFRKKIINYFVSSYKKGLTPNPCVACNKEMKFRLLFDLLRKEKADFVATGHYARLGREIPNPKSQINSKFKIIYRLLEAKDKTKNQSYFLYKLSQKELSKIIFPLGNYTKVEVRKIAKKFKLPISDGEESQDICFLQEKDINYFLGKHIRFKHGNIIDGKGNIIGKHKGLPLYTIGQRKGIEIGASGPYFTLGKNLKKNELIVTNDQKNLNSKKFKVKQVNWINQKISMPLSAKVQIRYHADKFPAIIKSDKYGNLIIKTKKPVRAVTPGQSAVFYKNKEILGGGIIK
ncbi:tRNA 2-thiouridine(34) synthase MnmA [bacterium]|nr:MAG: tRNA 2-thiouridine(34) synthase MnmA [bacterium]